MFEKIKNFFPQEIKVPKVDRDGQFRAKRIEIRYPTDYISRKALGEQGRYRIISVDTEGSHRLASVDVHKLRDGTYRVDTDFNFGNLRTQSRNQSNLVDANMLAYEIANKVATKISHSTGLPVEDKVLGDLEELEEEELAEKIKFLGNKKDNKSHLRLERRFSVFFILILVGIALSSYSMSTTGNAISNLTGTSQGLLGIFLFVFGIFGLVFGRR